MALATVVFQAPTRVIVKGQPKTTRVISIPHEEAVSLWWYHEGGKKPNPAQRQYISRVRRIFLDRKLAPAEYLEKHPLDDPEDRPAPTSWHQRYNNY